MKIHSVCTFSGCLNEGMNNIEAHYTRYFAKGNTVTRSPNRDITALIKHAVTSDLLFFFTRGTKTTYWLARLACCFCRRVFFVVVQRPEDDFLRLVKRHPLKCSYFYLDNTDVEELTIRDGNQKHKVSVGIDAKKFSPVTATESETIKHNYGFSSGKPLIVHVGHLSTGRGLEDFLKLDGNKYDRFIVDSGMYKAQELKDKLVAAGIRIVSGYIENIENIYRMADAYFFPTKSGDYVISVPLSVMEALSCGTPVVAYSTFTKFTSIETNDADAVTLVEDESTLGSALEATAGKKREATYLLSAKCWDEAAAEVLTWIKDESTK